MRALRVRAVLNARAPLLVLVLPRPPLCAGWQVFVAVLSLSYGLSMVLHLMVELPFANLIKLIM